MELSDLTHKRREHIQSCRDNNDNSHEIIASLYSDPSHFIYELLQNADDAGASEVRFQLSPQLLSFTHNGKKLFDFDDVDSITTVGSSTKKDDVNSIGTFGAGFKSVFAITKTPSVHSGDYHFQITDFIVPEEIKATNIEEKITEIILPFDHPDLSSDNAYKQISDRLQALESESLLFLRNIDEIQWKTEDDEGHYLAELKGNKASLISQVNGEDDLTEYFFIEKYIEIDGTALNIVVAYLLSSNGKILPVHDSKLFVFFPTNERTGFKFLVHAQYKTTPSRESVPFYDDQNKAITTAVFTLIAESILRIKNSGLLSVDVLSMLPIDAENDHPLYNAAFHQVKSIFATESLLPTSSGGYGNSENTILARERELTYLLEHMDCTKLFHREFWLHTDITYDKTRALRDYLISELNIPEITMQKFCSGIDEEFIKFKSDNWMMKFYSSIAKNKALYRDRASYQTKGVLRERPIIRLEDDSHVCPENNLGELQVYLPPRGQSKFKTVKRILTEPEESYEFLKSLGLEEPSNIAEIKEFIIPKYQGVYIEKDEYVDDFSRVLNIWIEADEYRRKEITDLLKSSQFIRCTNQEGVIEYQKPNDVYFQTKRITEWFSNNTHDDIYFLELPVKLSEDDRMFLESLGVRYNLKMYGITDIRVSNHGWYERSVNGFNPNFNIHGLKYALSNITFERSVSLWSLLLKNTNKLKGYIETKTNQNHSYKKGEEKTSIAMKYLGEFCWLYGRDQKIITLPLDQIALDDLNDDYQKEDENIEKLIKALGLKLDEILEFEEKTGKKVISVEDYELLQRIKSEQGKGNTETDQQEEEVWTPEADPSDVYPIEDEVTCDAQKRENLSGQTNAEDKGKGNSDDNGDSDENKNSTIKSCDKKAIGNWGEAVANKYLQKKYPLDDVVWLNKNGNVGKGYDFVIRNNGEDVAYFEVKSKIDESPQLFQVSGTQWSWAKELYNSQKGDMYRILIVANAGTAKPKIKIIKNPVKLWKSEDLYADPVNIEL